MHSGIRSLAATHKQIVVAYTGDIHAYSPDVKAPSIVGGGGAAPGVETIPLDKVSEDEKRGLEKEMRTWKEPGAQEYPNEIEYVPVWLHDKTARGHYDGYCKTSACILSLSVRQALLTRRADTQRSGPSSITSFGKT